MIRFTLRLPDSLHRQLRLRAAAEGVSVNQLIVNLLTSEAMLDEALVRAIKEGEDSGVVDREEVMEVLKGEKTDDTEWMRHLAIDPTIMSGKPVIKGSRLTVAYILHLLANGASVASILEEYDGLTEEDIRACLHLAAHVLT
jgi:uncharacterized protein (DUF433 family)